MEQNTPKFRLRLNLFDGIILIAALAVGAFLLWNAGKPQAQPGRPPVGPLHRTVHRPLPAVAGGDWRNDPARRPAD